MSILQTLLLFATVFAGLSLPFTRLVPRAAAPERLCVGTAGALLLCALAGLAGFLCLPTSAVSAATGQPRLAALLLPAASLACLWWFRRDARSLLSDQGLRQVLLAFALVCLGSLLCLALVVSYSGGGWTGDWLEHYERARFIRDHWEPDFQFLGSYSLAARPPLANLACAAFLQLTDGAFLHFQVLSCLFSCLAFLPMAALALRHGRGAVPQTLALLALLCLLNPLWVQNTAFPWTKLPTAFLILSALLFLEPAAPAPISLPERLIPWLLLSLGMLTHYSVAPWIITLVLLHALRRRAEWGRSGFWKEAVLCLAAAALLFCPWLLASLQAYGLQGTFGSNTTVAAIDTSLIGQLRVTFANLLDTLVPHVLRTPDMTLMVQSSQLGMLRDVAFNLYQLCLPLLCGFAGLSALFSLLIPEKAGRPSGLAYWVSLAALATLLGVAVHASRDEWGLAHICLQPLGLLGLVLVCTRLPGLGTLQRTLFWGLAVADWLLGVALPLLIQSLALPGLLDTGLGDKDYTRTLNVIAQYNLVTKLQHGLTHLGDLARPWQSWLLAGLLLLLSVLIPRALGREGRLRAARLLTPVLVAAAAMLLLATAVWFLRSTFMLYDDEGYVLFAMRGFAGHGALYDRVYSQYGPFFHLLADGLHRLGWPIDNMGARSLALVCWGGSAAACFALAWRLTRSLAASGLAMAAAFIHLWQMANEPSHPGGLIVLLLAIGALAGFHIRERPLGFGLVTGLVSAALVLTKVNVGLFFVAGAGLWYLLHARLPLSDTLRRTAVALLAALIPWLLMRGLLHEAWVRNFALICSLSFAAATLSVRPPRGYHAPTGMLAAAAGGFLLLASLTVGLMLARHSSLQGLLDGVLLSPLRMPTIFTSPINWRPGAVAGAFLALVLALSLDRLGSRTRLCLLLGGRFAVLTGFAASLAGLLPMNTLAYATNVGIASSWLFVAPLERRSDTSPSLAWLLLIGMLQILHAYPVAGSQLGWGSLLWIPLAARGGHEAWLWLGQRTGPVAGRLAGLGARLPVILTAIAALNFALMGWNRQAKGEALLLPGAENIIVPQHFASTARVIQNNLVLHCDSVFSAPGMFSFNLWSELPAPTLANATHWFSLLSERQKQELLEALRQDPHPGIVIQRGLLDYMRERSLPVDGPVMQYLRDEFRPVLQANHYELWLRKSQAAAIVGVARLAPTEQELLPLTLNLASVGLVELANFQIRQFDATDSRVLVRWSADNFLVRITPLHRDGTPRGPGQLCRPPLTMTGLNRLELLVRNCPVPPSGGDLVLVLQDQAGNRIGEALFLRDEAPAP